MHIKEYGISTKIIKYLILLIGIIIIFIPKETVFGKECSNEDNTGGPLNGYCDSWGNHVPGYITNDWWMTSTPQYTSGKMVFYGPWAMDATAEYRGITYDDCIGGISLMSPVDIGRKAWIKVNEEWHGPFCVVDCSKKGDMYSIVHIRQEVVEVNFDFAEKMGMVTVTDSYTKEYRVNNWSLDVEVWLPPLNHQTQSPDVIDKEPIHYPTWWIENVEYAKIHEPRIIQTNEGVWKECGNEKYWPVEFSDFGPSKSLILDTDIASPRIKNIPYNETIIF